MLQLNILQDSHFSLFFIGHMNNGQDGTFSVAVGIMDLISIFSCCRFYNFILVFSLIKDPLVFPRADCRCFSFFPQGKLLMELLGPLKRIFFLSAQQLGCIYGHLQYPVIYDCIL